MNNEEKILQILAQIQADITALKADVANLKPVAETMQEDIEILREDATEIRSATNTLLDWAERSEKRIGIPLIVENR